MHGSEDCGNSIATSLAPCPRPPSRSGSGGPRVKAFGSNSQSAAAPMSEENSATGSASMARQ